MKLTLRDLFWLVLVCAMAIGWWMRERQLAATIDGIREECENIREDSHNQILRILEDHKPPLP